MATKVQRIGTFQPNVAGPIEGALAQQVAQGNTPFAGSLLLSSSLERETELDQYNKTVQESAIAAAAAAKQAGELEARTRLQLGLLDSPYSGTAAAQLGVPQDQISQVQERERLKALGENLDKASGAYKSGIEAGAQIDPSGYFGQFGLEGVTQGTPIDITKENLSNASAANVATINNRDDLEVARIAAAASRYGADKRGASGGKTPYYRTVERLLPTGEKVQDRVPLGDETYISEDGRSSLQRDQSGSGVGAPDPTSASVIQENLPDIEAQVASQGYTGVKNPKVVIENGKAVVKFTSKNSATGKSHEGTYVIGE